MGCGCKNKGNQTQTTQSAQPTQNTFSPKQATNENIKDAIKKTVEKYYNANKR